MKILILSFTSILFYTLLGCGSQQTQTASLIMDMSKCRNQGTVEIDGADWILAESAPNEWRNQFPKKGSVTLEDDISAIFSAEGIDLKLAAPGQGIKQVCTAWYDEEGRPINP